MLHLLPAADLRVLHFGRARARLFVDEHRSTLLALVSFSSASRHVTLLECLLPHRPDRRHQRTHTASRIYSARTVRSWSSWLFPTTSVADRRKTDDVRRPLSARSARSGACRRLGDHRLEQGIERTLLSPTFRTADGHWPYPCPSRKRRHMRVSELRVGDGTAI